MATRKPRPRRPYSPHYWTVVTVRLRCHLGDHDATAGVWMRFRRGDHLRAGSCEDCLRRQYGIERPSRPVVLKSDRGVDARARRAGND